MGARRRWTACASPISSLRSKPRWRRSCSRSRRSRRTRHPPTFDNTLVALERAGHAFNRVKAIYDIWSSNMNTGDFQPVERELGPKIAAFYDAITQNTRLFSRIEAIHREIARSPEQLTAVQRRLCWHYYTSFVRAGAQLSAAAKARVGTINERLASLFAQFSQNLLADEANYVLYLTDPADLAGLPDAQCAGCRGRLGIGAPGSMGNSQHALRRGPVPDVRAPARLARGGLANFLQPRQQRRGARQQKIITEMLSLRSERAKLLGYPTHAHWHLADSMAGNPEHAMTLLMRIWPAAVARVHEEVADMQAIADIDAPGIRIEAWDYRFYAEKVRQVKFDLDMNEVKPYLQLEKLREGMFWAAGRLYGYAFAEVTGLPVYNPDVRVWEVKSEAGRHVGLWYFDPYARAGKNSGAWMSEYRDQDNWIAKPHPSYRTTPISSEAAPLPYSSAGTMR